MPSTALVSSVRRSWAGSKFDVQGRAVLQLGHFGPEVLKVGLLHGVHELALELAGHAAQARDHLADLAHHARQILGPDHDERDDADDQKFSGIDIEHDRELLMDAGQAASADEMPRSSSCLRAKREEFRSGRPDQRGVSA